MSKKIKKKKNNKENGGTSADTQHTLQEKKDSPLQEKNTAEPLPHNTQQQGSPHQKTPKRKLSPIIVALLVVLAGLVAFMITIKVQGRYQLAMQTDYSVNFRLALMDKADKAIHKGQYVAFYYKAKKSDERYGRHFVKRVACVPGEYITMKDRDFYCNNEFIGRAKTHDRTGKPAPLFQYVGQVPEGKFFAAGDTVDSYDSKYWGFASNDWIIGKVTKLI